MTQRGGRKVHQEGQWEGTGQAVGTMRAAAVESLTPDDVVP